MPAVFFVYGLAFFVLGMAIFLCPKKDSAFKLASDLWLISAFGILHGLNEWIDMFILIQKPMDSIAVKILRVIILPVSFLFLVQFGVKIILGHKKKYSILRALPPALFLIWIIITVSSRQWFLAGDIWARYLLGVPGIFMASYALNLQIPAFKKERMPGVVVNLRLAAGAFMCYGFFSGLVVPEAGFFPAAVLNYTTFLDSVGIPVQVFRAFCALAAAYSITKFLLIFDWETKNRLGDILKELKDAQDRIIRSEKLAVVGTLSAGIGHELRGPLSSIKNAVYYIKRKIRNSELAREDAKMLEFLDIIDDEVNASDKIITDILTFSRAGKPSFASSDVNAIINGALRLTKAPENIKVDKILKNNIEKAMIDKGQIRQVFLNIILNALQAMPHGGILKIETEQRQKFIEAKFADTGCGIAKEDFDKIFEPLFTTKGKGVGLGLAVSKAIVEKHEGKIEIESEAGKGTTFIVKLPIAG